MIKLENYEVMGWEHAIRGMRNPMNSWAKSDSFICEETGKPMTNEQIDKTCGICTLRGRNGRSGTEGCPALNDEVFFVVGPNDLALMTKLRNAGTDHRKFMRMIVVYVDITAPLYWWKEFDTYKVGTVANSCSTMHKIHAKEFTIEDFSCEHLWFVDQSIEDYLDENKDKPHYDVQNPMHVMNIIIGTLNYYREDFLITQSKKSWQQMIQLLPTSYNQTRTIMFNYEVLANIYKSRKNHKLDEWRRLCDWIETLPYSELIIGGREDDVQ